MATLESGVKGVKHIILVLSGKGGVGKSTVSSQLALSFAQAGLSVGLLDVDLTGPSIPKILGVDTASVHSGSSGWIPVKVETPKGSLCVMSIAFLLDSKDSPVIWRGPKKTAIIRQFVEDVMWGSLDVLLIDTPPGTSDEHISVCENLTKYNPDGAVIVTTPQGVSLSDVRKEITFCRKIGLPILGVVENMSGFVCPHCAECTNIFSSGGGEAMAKELNIPFIGRIPIDPSLGMACDAGQSFAQAHQDSKSITALTAFVGSFNI